MFFSPTYKVTTVIPPEKLILFIVKLDREIELMKKFSKKDDKATRAAWLVLEDVSTKLKVMIDQWDRLYYNIRLPEDYDYR